MKLQKYLILFVLILAFTLRLYRFDFPLADWHSWRQVDTSAVSRTFVQEGFDFLHPKYMDLSNIPSGLDNPSGYRFVEFPIFNGIQAGMFTLFDQLSLEQWGRLVSIFSSLIATLFIYQIVKRHASEKAALLSAFFYAALPFSIYFGRTVLPDQSMTAAILAGIYFFDVSIAKNLSIKFLLPSVFFTAIAILLKPYALFFCLPILFLAFNKYKLKAFLNWKLWLYLIISVLPLLLWRNWMTNYPEGIPQSLWLFNEGNIRFKGSFFYWIFADRLGRLILGYWGLALFAIGFLVKRESKNYWFFISFILASLLYVFTIARGNVQHDYYQILIVPSIAIFVGLGSEFLLTSKLVNKWAGISIFLICTTFTLTFSWYFVRDFFNINNESIVRAGREIDSLIPKGSKIIANYNGDTTFLYYTNRRGWPSFQRSLPEMREMGADYLALLNPTQKDLEIGKEYKIIKANNDFVLFDLNEKP